tara:strand:- start:217 stop:342 length:126 start_codon:yes stop_codon:yes gene_type:complete
MTPRERHEHMLIHVCGMAKEDLKKLSDAQVKKLFDFHYNNM